MSQSPPRKTIAKGSAGDRRPDGKRVDLRTLALVTIVTVMVWLLAESRTIRGQSADVSPRIEVGTASELLVRPAPGFAWPESVKLSLSGSTAGLGEVMRSMQGRLPLRVGIEIPATPGVHEVDLREVLRTSNLLIEAGVSINEVSPERLSIEVDNLRTASLPVRVVVPDGVAFEPNAGPRAVPNALRVRGPASVLARLEGLEGVVRLEPASFEPLTPGQASTLTRVRVELPEDSDRWNTVFESEYVDVSFTLRSRTQSYTLAAMPIQVLLAPGEVGRWRVTLMPGQQDLVGVEVTGPSDQIDRLRSGDVVPTALISLNFDELERGVETKAARVSGLPAGVQVSPGTDLTVRLSIQRTNGPEPAPD